MSDSRIILSSNIIIDQSKPPVHRTKCSEIYTGTCHATKVLIEIPSQRLQWNDNSLHSFREQLERRANLPHPNLCLLLGACIEPNVAIVLENTKGSISQLLHNNNIPLFKRLIWAKEAAQGISWLHGSSDPVIIEDLKLSNLYYDEGGKIKVYAWNPFGNIIDNNNLPIEYVIYRAPELLLKNEKTIACDVYSFGLLLYELITKNNVYSHFSNTKEFINEICNNHQRPIIPDNIDNNLKTLIQYCWHPDPEQRPSLTNIAEKLENTFIPQYENIFYKERIYKNISDSNGRNFWELFFLHKTEVSWEEFKKVFFPISNNYASLTSRIQQTNEEVINILPNIPSEEQLNQATTAQLHELASRNRVGRALVAKALQTRQNTGYTSISFISNEDMVKEILCPGENQPVSINNFGNMIGWFSPLDNNFIKRVKQVLSNPYFHGKLSFDQTNGILQDNMNNNNRPCLVRFSGSEANTFCICYVAPGPSIKHVKVHYYSGDGFKFQDNIYKTIDELINAAKQVFGFTSTCGDTPYLRFQNTNDDDEYYFQD